jgi:DNA-damage-inducible protein J
MANKENLTLRMDPELKKQASELFQELGLDLSTATGIFYRQALQCHGLPFEVKLSKLNATTYQAMDDAEKGNGLYGPYDSVDACMSSLDTPKKRK